MKYSICQNRDALRHMKKAHQYRAIMKRQPVTPSVSTSAHGRSSATHADVSGIRPLVANRGRASK